jgi:hypothetical protein
MYDRIASAARERSAQCSWTVTGDLVVPQGLNRLRKKAAPARESNTSEAQSLGSGWVLFCGSLTQGLMKLWHCQR